MKYMKTFRDGCACLVFFLFTTWTFVGWDQPFSKTLAIYGQTSSLAGELPLGQE
jgi:hypothetical protein